MDLSVIIIALAARHGHVDTDRLRGVADDITEVSRESNLFCGPAADEAAALALTAVAEHESGFWGKVQSCEACYRGSPFCDKGRSISLWQLHIGGGAWREYDRPTICGNNDIAARLALRILERHRKTSTPAGLFVGYARGGRRAAGPEMASIFGTLIRSQRITISYRDGCLTATTP